MYKEFTHGARVLPVLRDVNLTLMPGEMVTIIGASGAGKSTLLHCLGTLDLPTRGQILFGDTDITRFSPPQLASFRNETIGFVFQFHHLLGEFTALENAMMPALIGRVAHKEARERAGDMLNAVGLSHRLNHRPGELSGGEQQRVAIARALVMRPRLLLADEPTGNLDTRTSDEVHDLLFRINDEHKMTLLVVTHNMDLAWKVPRRIRMEDGKLVDEQVPLRNAMNDLLRAEYRKDCERVLKRWNRALEEAGTDFRVSLPDNRFHRRQGIYAGHTFDRDGNLITAAEFERQRDSWLPTEADRAYVTSLMKPVTEPGKMANWIAAPSRGIDGKAVDYEYVRLA